MCYDLRLRRLLFRERISLKKDKENIDQMALIREERQEWLFDAQKQLQDRMK